MKTKEKKQRIEQNHYYNGDSPEMVKVGEVIIQSQLIRSDDLCKLIVELLKQKEVKEYLGIVNNKKMSGSYFG